MKRIFAGLFVALTTFSIGILTAAVFHFPRSSDVPEIETARESPLFVPPIEEFGEETPRPTYIIAGYFYPFKTKGLDPEIMIDLTVKIENNKRKDDLYFHTRSQLYWTKKLNVNTKKLSFSTAKINGVEYRFDGKFLRNDFDDVTDEEIPVLEGILQKFKNGRKIREIKANFAFTIGC